VSAVLYIGCQIYAFIALNQAEIKHMHVFEVSISYACTCICPELLN